jgi:hypothetical protein
MEKKMKVRCWVERKGVARKVIAVDKKVKGAMLLEIPIEGLQWWNFSDGFKVIPAPKK